MTDERKSAAAVLRDAEARRNALVSVLRLPPGYLAASVVFWALFVLAFGLLAASFDDSGAAKLTGFSMIFVAGGVGWWQLRRFRSLNGVSVRVAAMRPGRTARATALGMLAYVMAIVYTAVAVDAERWALAALVAAAGGCAQAAATWWWMRIYRAEHGA